jgi:uncharacterized RDD family membrane protein YckC
VDKGGEFELLKAISHPIRARVIELLSENIELPYSEILRVLKIDSGQLNFHLRNMGRLITKGENGNYLLTREGKTASILLKELRRLSSSEQAVEPAAAVLKRALAAAIDFSLFLFSPLVVVFIVSLWIPFYERIDPVTVTLFLHAIFALTLVVFVAMEAYNGQTLGKFALGIRVIKENGRKPNLVECILRNVAKVYFLPLDFLLGVLFYRHKGYLRFSDYFTRVRVVDVPSSELMQ